MPITTTVVGSYPKPPNEGETFTIRKTLHALERGDAEPEDLARAQDDLVRQVIAEQRGAGIDVVTDGQVRWDDILTPFARNMSGFKIGGLLRWFDNNVYYRRPICDGPVEWRGPSSVEAFRFAQSVTDGAVKAVIPGPITFARGSVDEHHNDHEAFVRAIAAVLAQEAVELEAAGARFIQIDEPWLLDAPEDLGLAQETIGTITGGLSEATTILATYFGSAKRLGAALFDLPVHVFGFDLVTGPESRHVIQDAPSGTRIQAGVVDARNTKLEDEEGLSKIINDLATIVGPENLTVSPSAGLEYLPREKANAKLQRLASAARRVA